MSQDLVISEETIADKIYFIRNQKVMLDSNLATLYGIETRVLKQSVRRNVSRFPEDFMFELTEVEYNSLRSQIVTLKKGRGQHQKYLPMAFTEHGVLMLSSVLNSDKAIQTNIQIMRIFTKVRQMQKKLENHDKNIELVFSYLDELTEKEENRKPRTKIGYKK